MLAIIFDGVGAGEWLVLLAVILIVVGPQKMPSMARNIGRWYNKFRRAAESFKRQLMEMDTEFEQTINEVKSTAEETISEVQNEFKDLQETPSDGDRSFEES